LPVSDDYTGHTQYFMIPTETLPLLQPLQSIPVIGQPLYDLLEPDMRILVNLGYGNIDHGWDPGLANVPTTFGLFPSVNPVDVLTALANGAQEGIQNFIHDLGSLSTQSMPGVTTNAVNITVDSLPSFTDIANAFSSALASGYATLLPTADIANALITTLPAYAAGFFVQELSSGNLVDAIGLPIAAVFGLGSMAVGFEFDVIENAVTSLTGAFQDLIPS
ncbi:MAG: PE-PPE domain-containing protein, partial [Mycobacterium sp.]